MDFEKSLDRFLRQIARVHTGSKDTENAYRRDVERFLEYLRETYQFKDRDDLFFAGQMTGVEGYVESAASGMLAGINMAHVLKGEEPVVLGVNTMMGAMAHYITHADPNHFQPMNANFGIMHLEGEVKKKDRKAAYAPQALKIIQELKEKNGL